MLPINATARPLGVKAFQSHSRAGSWCAVTVHRGSRSHRMSWSLKMVCRISDVTWCCSRDWSRWAGAVATSEPCRCSLVQGFPEGSAEGKAMAQRVAVMLIDDIDQLEAAETVRFGVDGTAYEIDLSARHASELRSMAGRYIRVARRIRPAPSRARQQYQPRTRTQMDREQSRRIRSWALERGLLGSPRGRIPQHVVDEYEATMRVASAPFRSPGTAEPEPASNRATTGKGSPQNYLCDTGRVVIKAEVAGCDAGVPVRVELVRSDDLGCQDLDLLVCDLDAGRVAVGVQLGLYPKADAGGGGADGV